MDMMTGRPDMMAPMTQALEIVTVTKRVPRPAAFEIRTGTSDAKSIEEVFDHNSYQRYKMPVTDLDRWLDLGANIGAFSVMAGLLGRKVVAVEADPDNHARVLKNLAMNGLEGVTAIQAAAMPDDYAGDTITLHRSMAPKSLRRHTIYPSPRRTDQISVPALSISNLCTQHDIQGVKMNIEGAEIGILTTWKPPTCVRRVVAEWSFDKDPKIATIERALENLRNHFPTVKCSRKWAPDLIDWKYYPPNAFIYASY